jgi:putative hydrolase of the HAD superfamily
MKTRLILFDLYKTLIDMFLDEESIEPWSNLALFLRYKDIHCDAAALRETFFLTIQREYQAGLSETRYPEIDMVTVIRKALAVDQAVDDHVLIDALQMLRALITRRFGLFPDVLPTLTQLKPKYQLGLVTNAYRLYAEAEMKMLGLDQWWDVVVMSSDHGISKPAPELFHLALEQLQVSPAEAIYVGDSIEHDVAGARNAGLKVVHINRETLVGDPSHLLPDWSIQSLEQLLSIVN